MSTKTKKATATPVIETPTAIFNHEVAENKTKYPIWCVLYLSHLMLKASNRQDEINFNERTIVEITMTEADIQQLIDDQLLNSDGTITKKGEKLVLKATSLGNNFDTLVNSLTINALISLFFKVKDAMVNSFKDQITLVNNKTGQESKLSIGMREAIQQLADIVEWPVQTVEKTPNTEEIIAEIPEVEITA
jgi:hypothetical protein